MVINQKIEKKNFWCNNAFFGAIMHQKLCFYLLDLKNRKKIFWCNNAFFDAIMLFRKCNNAFGIAIMPIRRFAHRNIIIASPLKISKTNFGIMVNIALLDGVIMRHGCASRHYYTIHQCNILASLRYECNDFQCELVQPV